MGTLRNILLASTLLISSSTLAASALSENILQQNPLENATWFDLNCRRQEIAPPNYPFPFSFVTHQSLDLRLFTEFNLFGNIPCLVEYVDVTIAGLGGAQPISDLPDLIRRGRELLINYGERKNLGPDSGIIYYQFPVDSNIFFGNIGEVWTYLFRNPRTLKLEMLHGANIAIRIFDDSVELKEFEERSDTERNWQPNYQIRVVHIPNAEPFFRFRATLPNIIKNSAWSQEIAFEKNKLPYWEKLNRSFSYFLTLAEAQAATPYSKNLDTD